MAATCPECGADEKGGETCLARYHRFLALEFSDPAFGAVHHLTVLAYSLQHPSQVSRPGWLQMRAMLREFLHEGLSPQRARRRIQAEQEKNPRAWSISSGPRQVMPGDFSWGLTIQSVDDSSGEIYAGDITRWAVRVLADAAGI